MAANAQFDVLDGLFKVRYGEKLENAIPEITILQTKIGFKSEKRLGDEYIQPVTLGREHGCTYIARGDGLVTLAAPVAGNIRPAKIKGVQHVWRFQIDYASIFASQDMEAAFDNSVGVQAANGLESARHRLEMDMFWGQNTKGLATVGSVTTGAAGFIVVDTAEWGPGIWNGMEGAIVNFWDTTLASTHVTGAATSTITKIDADARKITFDSVPTNVVVGDVVLLLGMRSATPAWKVMVGLHTLMSTSGVVFNIDNTLFSMWRASTVDALGLDLSFDILLKAFAKVSIKGGSGEYLVLVNPTGFANLMSDQGALRRYDKADSPTKYEVGASDITFYTQTGSMKIMGHPMQKEGYAHGIPVRKYKRIGASDITFETAKMEGVDTKGASQFFLPIPDKNGVEFRCYSDQALFTSAPGLSFYVTNIVNS